MLTTLIPWIVGGALLGLLVGYVRSRSAPAGQKRSALLSDAALGAALVGLAGYVLAPTGGSAEEAFAKLPTVTGEEGFRREVLGAKHPTLVEFYSPTCGPCRRLAPQLAELSGEYADRVNFRKVNASNDPALMRAYNIPGVPTVVIFAGGEPRKRLVGYCPQGQYIDALNEVLAEHPPSPEASGPTQPKENS